MSRLYESEYSTPTQTTYMPNTAARVGYIVMNLARGVTSDSPLGPQNLVLYYVRESAALVLYWLFGM